jgi:gliding motility-associated GldM-like protein/TonB-like protein
MFRFLSTCLFLAASCWMNAQTSRADTLQFGNDSSQVKMFDYADIDAYFPGGERGWRQYIAKNLRSDIPATHGAPAGIFIVSVQFMIDKHGNVSNVKALTNNGFGMEQEVIRIVENSLRWEPASENGKLVKQYRVQAVTFVVEADGFEIFSREPYVFYEGVDNPITIRAHKTKPSDLHVTISRGTIFSRGNGNYVIHVTRTGRVLIQMFNKKNKQIGAASFEVKDPASKAPIIIKG